VEEAAVEPDPQAAIVELVLRLHGDDGVSSFVTFGRKAITFWEYMVDELSDGTASGRIAAAKRSPKVGRWSVPRPVGAVSTGRKVEQPADVLAACYVEKDLVVAGTAEGKLVCFHGCCAVGKRSIYRAATPQVSAFVQ
jgi:hypothetical protein